MHGACSNGYIRPGRNGTRNMVSIDDSLCARLCNPVFCARFFPWHGKMDFEIFRFRYEDWRSRHDIDGYFAVYRPNDQNYDLVEYHYAGMACILIRERSLLSKIFNFCIWKMVKDALRYRLAERICLFIGVISSVMRLSQPSCHRLVCEDEVVS